MTTILKDGCIGDVGVHIHTQQESVEESLYVGILVGWQLAVAVSSHDGISTAVGDTIALVHFSGCVHRHISRIVAKPLHIGVA